MIMFIYGTFLSPTSLKQESLAAVLLTDNFFFANSPCAWFVQVIVAVSKLIASGMNRSAMNSSLNSIKKYAVEDKGMKVNQTCISYSIEGGSATVMVGGWTRNYSVDILICRSDIFTTDFRFYILKSFYSRALNFRLRLETWSKKFTQFYKLPKKWGCVACSKEIDAVYL